MGCVASRIDKDERVRICRERKRLMKHLLGVREEFVDAQLAYLRALKNTGVTLRQFTESESLEIEDTSYPPALPTSPPPILPPSLPPPPPPPYSPDRSKVNDYQKDGTAREESIEINENDCGTQPSPSLEFWEELFPVPYHEQSEEVEQIEEENWAETKTEFEEDDQEEKVVSNPVAKKSHSVEVVDDNSSTMSCCTKDTEDMAMVVCSKKTLDGIINELDDYFLKASGCGKKIAVLMNISKGDTYLPLNINENKRKRSNSAKVFSALSWSWSFKSLQSSHGDGATDFCGSSEPCKPGAHSITLEKLYAAEQKLYKEVKEEEMAKLEHERKSMLLQRQEDENHPKIEKTRSCVESLESEIRRLQFSISETCSSILNRINRELYPQLVTLISG